MKPKLLIVMGPTASGKTAVCCELAKQLPLELISCDSMQVYKGMPVLTQAPGRKESKILRAHLTSFLEPSKEYDASRFRQDASELITKILKKKKTPLISGGTGLYLRALLDGLFEITGAPDSDMKLRKKLLKEQEEFGGSCLHDKLREVDPESADKIHPNDLRRLVRALEVYFLSGEPLSKKKTQRTGIRGEYDGPVFFLDRDREDLYDRINCRVDRMFEDGLIREVKRILKKRLSKTASMALGFREVADFLKGKNTLENTAMLIKQYTRNYAKRQISWFRHEKGVIFVPVLKNERPADTARKILELWNKGELPR